MNFVKIGDEYFNLDLVVNFFIDKSDWKIELYFNNMQNCVTRSINQDEIDKLMQHIKCNHCNQV